MAKPQPMEPHGLMGRVFAFLMERLNTPAYMAAIRHLAPQRGAAYLEVGFGTGGLLVRLARAMGEGRLAGIDPSDLMVGMATRRLRCLEHVEADLHQGTASHLPWPDAGFDGAAALHCFQFWATPESDMAELARVLKPGASVVFIVRDHSRRTPDWLPNPLSRSANEAQALMDLLGASGFDDVVRQAPVGSSQVVTARRAGLSQ